MALVLVLLAGACSTHRTSSDGGHAPAPEEWKFDNLETIGGHPVAVVGEPRVVRTAAGPAVEFDGHDDALFFDRHPLEGVPEFTAEIVFRPDEGGPIEQRFWHMQEDGSDDRVLFETRVRGDTWFLDTFIESGGERFTLYAKQFRHPIGPWYHAAIVVDGEHMRHYVNGVEELSRPIDFVPPKRGRSSVGVRINEVSWFKGAVREIRITTRALPPQAFLEP